MVYLEIGISMAFGAQQVTQQTDDSEIWSKQLHDLNEEREVEDMLTTALIGLRMNGPNPEQLDMAIASLTKAQGFLIKYTSDIKIIPWTINRLQEENGDEIEIFERARNKLIIKLSDIGFRIPKRKKVPWEEKLLDHLQLKGKISPEELERAKGNPKKKLT